MRPYPFLGHRLGRLRHRQADWSRTSSGCVEHYRARGFLEAKARADAATSPAALGEVGAVAAAAETVSREAHDLYVRFSIVEGPRVHDWRPRTSRRRDGDAPALRPQLPARERGAAPGRALRAGRSSRRTASGWFGCSATPASAWPRVEPDVDAAPATRSALTWKVKPGPRVRVGPTFVRGNFVTTRLDRPPSRSRSIRAPLLHDDLGGARPAQPRLHAALQQRLRRFRSRGALGGPRPPVRAHGRRRRGALRAVQPRPPGRRRLDRPTSDPNSSFPVGVYARVGYENRNLLGPRLGPHAAASPSGKSLLRAQRRRSSTGASWGRCSGSTPRSRTCSQATVRLGDIHSGGGSIGFSRELYPGVDAGLHYNLRNTTHTEPLLRQAGPDRDH